MAYNLNTFDGRSFATVEDGVVDQQISSSLNLIGKDVVGYGTYQNDNFLWLMEHFAGSIEPIHKVQGQIWFDKGALRPKVYDNAVWHQLAIMNVTSIEPSASVKSGDLWFDSVKGQLFIKNTGTGYTLVGPEKVFGYGKTRIESIEVLSSSTVGHAVLVMYADDEVIGTISIDEFDVKSTESLYTAGITRIGRGFTFVAGAEVKTDTNFTRNAFDETITGHWQFDNSSGISINNASIYTNITDDLVLETSGNNLIVNSGEVLFPGGTTILATSSSTISKIYVSELSGGTSIAPVTLTGQFGLTSSSKIFPNTDNFISLGKANARWNQVYTTSLNAGGETQLAQLLGNWQLTGNSTLDVTLGTFVVQDLTTGGDTIEGTLTGDWTFPGSSKLTLQGGALTLDQGNLEITAGNLTIGDGNFTIGAGIINALDATLKTRLITTGSTSTEGTITGNWSLSEGSQLRATYADLAEFYSSDNNYEPGTVLVFGGTEEVTKSAQASDTAAAGIVTTNPAYVLNEGLKGTRVCIALAGRVPCNVVGKVNKGDLLVTSYYPGHAEVSKAPKPGTIIGKALANKHTDGTGVIEVMVVRG
jgi:hypothetical protein